jgi:hypothetical protein
MLIIDPWNEGVNITISRGTVRRIAISSRIVADSAALAFGLRERAIAGSSPARTGSSPVTNARPNPKLLGTRLGLRWLSRFLSASCARGSKEEISLKALTLAATAMLVAAPTLAQTTTAPGQTGAPVVQGGSPSTANSGPASTGTVVRGGTRAESVSNNPAGAGNAEQPERAVPNTGRGGGGDPGGGSGSK